LLIIFRSFIAIWNSPRQAGFIHEKRPGASQTSWTIAVA
jgi:hypothetical protein